MIDFLLASVIATAAPRTSSPVYPANPAPVVSPTSKPATVLPAVPAVYPSRNSPSTTQPSNKSWSDKVWERYQDRRRNLPSN